MIGWAGAKLTGIWFGLPVGFTPQLTIDLDDSEPAQDWQAFAGSAYLRDVGAGWGGGWGHYEIGLGRAHGQTPARDAGLASGGGPDDQSYGAGFDAEWGTRCSGCK